MNAIKAAMDCASSGKPPSAKAVAKRTRLHAPELSQYVLAFACRDRPSPEPYESDYTIFSPRMLL